MADMLLRAAGQMVFRGGNVRASYPEGGGHLLFERSGRSAKVAAILGDRVLNQAEVDLLLLCGAVATFADRVGDRLFHDCPLLRDNARLVPPTHGWSAFTMHYFRRKEPYPVP
ncbi:MAG: hypothetical protein RLO08_05790 [Parvibaculaceae bacterium]